ncbi:nitrous oxide reductase family maturation protein NosD [Neobacillus massiliamazoniensis]|uniref:Carbohydrate-binding and sugar hydrolysis protein n=1 Tax=Neobacillus massiliamazoniensis TaxID=1499688 RepID=A0A0U1NXQ1_9BACI|nr:nitrous oxide reductase family maturation protein NosD [Neobacillus massiliamazoniensis]CRK82562.1 carbohydrate-binding and sugar hydrolysis protein [Neobacillus massiliamazoniensis]
MKKWTLFSLTFSLLLLIYPEKNMAAENLQSMIDSMKEGAVLKLKNKTYEGNIIIDKSITIIGSNKTVIKGDGTGNVISIKAPNVHLSHLTVRHSSMSLDTAEEYAAIKIYSNENVVDHVTVRDSFHGIYISQGQYNTIRDNDIRGLGKGEIASQGNGLHVYYANNNLLENNRIEGTRDGMFFDYANNNRSFGNQISNTRYGLHYMYSDENTFENNTFTMNIGGAAIMNSNYLKLRNNQFIFNDGNQSFGLLLMQANDNYIEKNTFYMNQRGIYIDQSTRNLYLQNKIVQNQIGIELWGSSNKQTFSLNRITDNNLPAVTIGGKGEGNAWSKNNKGNDWGSAFPLTDLNQDGIGDFPVTYHSSLHQLLENQELTNLFLKSPAIAIYEKMNALLEHDDVMFSDSYPLVTKHPTIHPLLIGLGILSVLILFKGRHRLCIMFGRNGKKI